MIKDNAVNDEVTATTISIAPLALREMGLFRTPDSISEIVNWIEALPAGERGTAWTVFGMFNNLAVDRGVAK